MPTRYKSVELRPPQGGKLIGGLSEDTGSGPNYSIKKNFRRDLDVEMRREGWDLFNPKFDKNPLNMPLYEDDEVTMLFQFARPNGNTALIAAAGDKMYRLFANDELADWVNNDWVYPDRGRSDAYHKGGEFSYNWKVIREKVSVPGSIRSIEMLSEGEYFKEDSQVNVEIEGIGSGTGVIAEPTIEQPQGEDAPVVSGDYSGDRRRLFSVDVFGDKFNLYRGAGDDKVAIELGADVTSKTYFEDDLSITFPKDVYSDNPQTFTFIAKPRRVGSVIVTNPGKEYKKPPEITITDSLGKGTGAMAIAHINDNLRWESVAINGYAISNNGIDIPYVYREEWMEAKRLYALRELGIIRVGCIAEHGGYLLCGDLTEFAEGELERWHGICKSNNLDPYGNVTPELIREHDLKISETQYAIAWSQAGNPLQWGVSTEGSMVGGSKYWYPEYPGLCKSFEVGQPFIVTGAAENGANLTTTIEEIGYAGNGDVAFFKLAHEATSTDNLDNSDGTAGGDGVADGTISNAESYSNTVGGESVEILGDGSRVLKMVKLMDTLVIYRQTGYWLAGLTNSTTDPFSFTERYHGHRAASFRHTVTNIVDKYHIFVGLNGVFKIDLTEAEPSWVPAFQVGPQFWKDLSLHDQEQVFTFDNALTGEIWLCMPEDQGDEATIAFDYRTNTLSHVDQYFSAGLTIRRPQNPFTKKSDDMVIITYNGVIYTYGYGYGEIPAVYNRVNQEYTSVLQSTLMNFEDRFNEKDIRSYVLLLDQTETTIGTKMELFTQGSLLDERVLAADHTILDLDDETMVPVWSRALFYKDKVTVTGKDNPLRLASRIFEVSDVFSRSQTQTIGEGYGGGGGGGSTAQG